MKWKCFVRKARTTSTVRSPAAGYCNAPTEHVRIDVLPVSAVKKRLLISKHVRKNVGRVLRLVRTDVVKLVTFGQIQIARRAMNVASYAVLTLGVQVYVVKTVCLARNNAFGLANMPGDAKCPVARLAIGCHAISDAKGPWSVVIVARLFVESHVHLQISVKYAARPISESR